MWHKTVFVYKFNTFFPPPMLNFVFPTSVYSSKMLWKKLGLDSGILIAFLFLAKRLICINVLGHSSFCPQHAQNVSVDRLETIRHLLNRFSSEMTVSAVISPAVNSSSLVVGVGKWSILRSAVVAVPRSGSSSRLGCERCKMQWTDDFSTDWADLKRGNRLRLVGLIKKLLSPLSSAARASWPWELRERVPWRAWKEFNNCKHNFSKSELVYGKIAKYTEKIF